MDKQAGDLRNDVNDMTIATYKALKLWLVDNDKSAMLEHYNNLTPFQRGAFLDALQNVLSKSESKDFRRASKEIPEYIKANQPKKR